MIDLLLLPQRFGVFLDGFILHSVNVNHVFICEKSKY